MRVAVQTESSGALELIERVLDAAGAIAREHPLFFGEAAPGRFVTLAEDDSSGERVLSACAILPRELVTPQGIVRAGLIGSVATDPTTRGKGLATEVLARAETELAASGALFALLWADAPAFYEKRGWCAAGTEIDWLVSHDLAPALPSAREVRPAREEDFAALHALYEQHASRVLRTGAETGSLLRSPHMRTLVLERAGALTAYACEGRGRDMQGVVHEWAGESEDVLALLRAHVETSGNDLMLLAPSGETALSPRLVALGCPRAPGVLGMAKLLRLDRAALLIERLAGEGARVREGLGGLFVEGPRATVHVLPDAILDLLLGTRDERAQAAELEATTGLDLSRLPLAAFLWGLDSI